MEFCTYNPGFRINRLVFMKIKSFKMELEYPNLIKPEIEIIFYFKDLEDYKYIQMSRLH